MKLIAFFCLILANATAMVQAQVQTHPRLWLTEADLPRLRAWANDSNPLYRDALKPLALRAKAEMDSGDVPRRDCGSTEYEAYPTESYAQLFAFMAQVENDAAVRADYASRARTLLMSIINIAAQGPAQEANYICPENQQSGYPPYRSPRFFTEDSNRARWHGEAFPLVVDWIYPTLTAQDKQTIRTVFLRWSQEIIERGYHHPTPIGMVNDPALLANNEQVRWSGNNYFTAHMRNLGMMAMALDPADDANNSLRNYLGNATGAWLYLFDSLINNESRGGLLPEGYEYSPQTASYAIQFLLALRSAGMDTCGSHCQMDSSGFWYQFLYAFYHSLSPAPIEEANLGPVYLPAWYGDGENYHSSDFISAFGALGAYDILTGNNNRLPSLRWAQTHMMPGGAANFMRRASNPDDFRHTILYFMLYDPTLLPAADPRPALSLHHHATGLQTIFSRTSWNNDASWFIYSLPWNQIDHQQSSANHFEWYRNGEWLTKARNGYPDIAEGIASSEFKNLLALENDKPNRDDSDWRTDLWRRGSQWNLVGSGNPLLVSSAVNEHYLYAFGDATNTYNASSENATDIVHASRSLLWLKPDTVVMLDRAQSKTANRFKRWWLQLATPASISTNRARATTAGGQQLQVTSLLPAGALLSAVNSNDSHIEQTAARNEPMRVRLRIDAPDNPQQVYFLNVLQAANAGASLPAVSLINSSDQEFSGAQIGGTVVLLPRLVDRSYTRLSYSATNADTHIIGGLMPSTAYSLNISGNNYSIEPGGFRQSDSGGVLRVAINLPLSDGVFSGNRSNYSITPSGSSYNVSDNVGSGGTVSVGSVTRLRFNDTWVALDVNGNAGNVFRLYQAAFDRAPDAGGMGFHLATMEKLGFTLRQVAENFVNSAEFAAKYANTSNAQFITLLYQNILHRQPEAGGFAFWVGVLDRGAESRTGILNSFAASQENQDGTATSLQSGINYTPFNF